MTSISNEAAAVREMHRQASGEFGVHERSVPAIELNERTFPPLKGGLTAQEIDVTVRRGAHDNVQVSFEPSDGSSPFTMEYVDELDENTWCLADAPDWLMKPALENLIDRDDPDAQRWSLEQHQKAMSQGAISTSHSNAWLSEIDATYPANARGAADALDTLGQPDEQGEFSPEEREDAAYELSRRAAEGIVGDLKDVRDLRAGERVYVGHFDGIMRTPTVGDGHVTVTGVSGADYDEYLETDGGTFSLPHGTHLPVQPRT